MRAFVGHSFGRTIFFGNLLNYDTASCKKHEKRKHVSIKFVMKCFKIKITKVQIRTPADNNNNNKSTVTFGCDEAN